MCVTLFESHLIQAKYTRGHARNSSSNKLASLEATLVQNYVDKNKWILHLVNEHILRHYLCMQEGSLDLVIWVTGGGVDQSPIVEKVFSNVFNPKSLCWRCHKKRRVPLMLQRVFKCFPKTFHMCYSYLHIFFVPDNSEGPYSIRHSLCYAELFAWF